MAAIRGRYRRNPCRRSAILEIVSSLTPRIVTLCGARSTRTGRGRRGLDLLRRAHRNHRVLSCVGLHRLEMGREDVARVVAPQQSLVEET